MKKVHKEDGRNKLTSFIYSIARIKYSKASGNDVFKIMSFDNYWIFVKSYENKHPDRFIEPEKSYN